uniref:receptor protein-tyrosine kinase n=1 Tax=Branchiostoma floridae TaxID=7739 RepID=C3YCQ6_BRAFL|eukprot:XP_002605847.1 hypothetical protein BRAFLDRAFT_90834 [Branchiostoma floridae]
MARSGALRSVAVVTVLSFVGVDDSFVKYVVQMYQVNSTIRNCPLIDVPFSEKQRIVSATLSNLQPQTTYNLSAVTVANGRRGQARFVTFRTEAATVDPRLVGSVSAALVVILIAAVFCTVRIVKRLRYKLDPAQLFKEVLEDIVGSEKMEPWLKNRKDLFLEDLIGEGEFGHVRKGLLREKRQHAVTVAAKTLRSFSGGKSVHTHHGFDIRDFEPETPDGRVRRHVSTTDNIITPHKPKTWYNLSAVTVANGRRGQARFVTFRTDRGSRAVPRSVPEWARNGAGTVRGATELIGEGEFGHVRKGLLREKRQHAVTVAAKTLRVDRANETTYRDFAKEASLLVEVNDDGGHVNIVRLIGLVIDGVKKKDPRYILVEYAEPGELLWYLVSIQNNRHQAQFPPGLGRQLTEVAIDIARGMLELKRRRITHRDLACRNIVLTSPAGQAGRLVAKISDFGLARDVYITTQYMRHPLTNILLPIKWMAIESLIEGVYSCKSDMWGFGVVLWEIATLGGTPYPEVCGYETLVTRLRRGYRLQKPNGCSDEL